MFSVLFVLIVATPIVLIIFAASKFFLPFWSAAIMAIFTTLGGMAGFAFGLIAQTPFTQGSFQSTASVLVFLGIGAASSLIAAIITGWTVWQFAWTKKPKPTELQFDKRS